VHLWREKINELDVFKNTKAEIFNAKRFLILKRRNYFKFDTAISEKKRRRSL
jgi:hypothetical protein